MEWHWNGENNCVLSFDGFFISFNPQRVENPFDELISALSGVPLSKSPETAIVIRGESKNTFYILEGDFRAELSALATEGLEPCLAFFHSHRELWSQFSYHPERVN